MVRPAVSHACSTRSTSLRRRVGDGQQHLLEGVAAGRMGDVVDRADDRDADHGQPVGPGVVVEDGHRHQTGPRAPQHLADGRGAGVAAPDHGHPQPDPA